MKRKNKAWIILFSVAVACQASDWPAYQSDARRSGATDERLAFPLTRAWEYRSAQPPRPAWPEPGRELHRIDFDYAFHPVMAQGLVCFGSSADDSIRALDAATGEASWRFATGGPVRFAPHVYDGKCYAASDDGFVYCLNAGTGELLWKFRAAPADRQIIGNGRMISRWPCRSGALAVDGVVYVTAGLWPSEGIYVYALNAKTGKEIWRNDTSGGIFMAYPHGGAFAIGGVAPQGYLLASDKALLVPTGRSVPAAFDRMTGRLMYYHAGIEQKSGGCWATMTDEFFFNPLNAGGGDVSVRLDDLSHQLRSRGVKGAGDKPARVGAADPEPGDGMRMYSVETGLALETFPGRQRVLAAGHKLYAAGGGVVEALTYGKTLWTSKHPRVCSLALADNALLVGGSGSITAFDAGTGTNKWSAEIPGQACSIAVADGRLVVGTKDGILCCFESPQILEKGAGNVALAPTNSRAESVPVHSQAQRQDGKDEIAAKIVSALHESGITKGYALIVGASDARAAETLASETELDVICLFNDQNKAESERERLLDDTTCYGSRVVARHHEDSAILPYADYFANAVVVLGDPKPISGNELYRVLHPSGGIMLFPGLAREEAQAIVKQTGAPASEILTAPASLPPITSHLSPPTYHLSPNIRRGKLPGAFDWDSTVASDQRVKWPLELLWFGGPGPARMVGRHWGAPTPIPANGRYFVIGEHHLIAVDAYNGLEFWSREIKDFFWNVASVSADDESVYVNFADATVELDARTGLEKKIYAQTAVSNDPLTGKPPVAPVAAFKDLPDHARRPARIPPVVSPGDRPHPLMGENTEKTYKRAHGCGGIISSAAMEFFRSGTLGFYDWEDDSGVRNFAGVRPGCGNTMIPAMGLLIANEGSAACSCSYNYQTSLALAPAAAQKNEDWAVFYDREPLRLTKHAALNLGAPGDRRDSNGVLWMGIPRPAIGLQMPCALEIEPGYAPYRVNADITSIADTDWPWIYASGIPGLKRVVLDLESFGGTVSLASRQQPKIDGRMEELCWRTNFPLSVAGENALVLLRHDAENIYLAYNRPAVIDRFGRPTPWKSGAQGNDAPVWQDDSCEITFSDANKDKCVHLGVSASGARYDGLWTYAYPEPIYDIPRLDNITIDGETAEWGDSGFRVRSLCGALKKMLPTHDFDPSFRLGWNDDGLLVLIEARDDTVIEYQSESALWAKDSIEIFMADRPGSRDTFQLALGTGSDPRFPQARAFFLDNRVSRKSGPLTVFAEGRKTDEGYITEILLPWKNLGIAPKMGRQIAFQILINDADQPGPFPCDWFRALWHPAGHAGFSREAFQRVRLSASPSAPVEFRRGVEPDQNGFFTVESGHSYPVIAVPRIDDLVADGKPDDWGERGFRQISLASESGVMRMPDDFDPSFRLAWNNKGLFMLVQTRDQTVLEEDTEDFWKKDSIEIFMAPRPTASEFFQITISPGADAKHTNARVSFFDKRVKKGEKGALAAEVIGGKTTDGYLVEILLPWKNLAIEPFENVEIGLQVFVNDSDDPVPYPADWFRVAWHPNGHPDFNGGAFHRVRLAADPGDPVVFKREEPSPDVRLIQALSPHPWPLPKASAGVVREDNSWNGEWESAVKADESAFMAEMAVPWKTLESAGLDRERLVVDFCRRGPVAERPTWSFVPVDFHETTASPPRQYTVRLHFAELRDIAAGQRVFDVKLQDKLVLKDFDIMRESGGVRRALVKEFKTVTASTMLAIDFAPQSARLTEDVAPVLSGLEVVAE